MTKVCVLQTDNRPLLDYLLKTKNINNKCCNILGYDYLFLELNNPRYGDISPATKKIYLINDFLQKMQQYDILIFLDSDAWIQNYYLLKNIINNLINSEKYGCFSRDPYLKKNTFINSGSFIIKINDFTKKMYTTIINHLHRDNSHWNNWPFDQYYISNYIFQNKDNFFIFQPNILNTPIGKILRHNWLKNQKMYDDLDDLLIIINNDKLIDNNIFIENDYYDKEEFPNKSDYGYEYYI